MNLLNAKECSKCANSIVYGSTDNKTVHCKSLNSKTQELFKENGICSAAFCPEFIKCNKNRSGLINQKDALRFMLSGNAEFIMHSTINDSDYRYILKAEKANYDDKKLIYFVNMIKGSDKIYCGVLYIDDKTNEFKFSQGTKGELTQESVDIRSLLFVLNNLMINKNINGLKLYSVGKCGCCGKYMTEDEDLDIGLHSSCIKHSKYNYICNKENS
jgi:hypothetical protein